MAKIILKSKGAVIHRETKTFDRERAAIAWLAKREGELEQPGEIERSKTANHTLADAIDKYVETTQKNYGKTKAQVLKTTKEYTLAGMACDKIKSQDIVEFAIELSNGRKPQTVGNYLSHLATIFTVAKPAWGYPLSREAMDGALVVLKRMGIISKSKQRDRRPTLEELEKLLAYFYERRTKVPQSMPMHVVIVFALFSTRRQEEITRIAWADYEPHNKRVLVRDMKNPGEKIGNDVWVDLPVEAMRVIDAMPRRNNRPQIFPYTGGAITTNFTRACQLLGIEDLHFHDLRHEGVSRLFELGWNIPHVAAVSGHRSWTSLKRYTHIRERGDKYADWPWLDVIAPQPAAAAE